MSTISEFQATVEACCGEALLASKLDRGELTVELQRQSLLAVCQQLRDRADLQFSQLMDVCGLDYSTYAAEGGGKPYTGPRYAVVYHLLSVEHNRRLRLRVFLDEEFPVVDSVIEIWSGADWFEREAFDLFGFVFDGHPDLRRILTDYGFIGHPFRKDFRSPGMWKCVMTPTRDVSFINPSASTPGFWCRA